MSKNVLLKIQKELHCPKKRFNSFRNYYYRNAEDIMASVKPLLEKYEAILTLTASIEEVLDRIFVRVDAKLEWEGGHASASGYAQHDESKKGMDGGQLTGAITSYASKYALGMLFLIDDGNDLDEISSNWNPPRQAKKKPVLTEESGLKIKEAREKVGAPPAKVVELMQKIYPDPDLPNSFPNEKVGKLIEAIQKLDE